MKRNTPTPRRLSQQGLTLVESLISLAVVAVSLGLLLVFWSDVVTHTPRQNPTVSTSVYETDLVRSQLKQSPVPAAGESRAMLRHSTDLRLHTSSATTPDN